MRRVVRADRRGRKDNVATNPATAGAPLTALAMAGKPE
jgi:hypothetical protein